jgi:hypothetical protein
MKIKKNFIKVPNKRVSIYSFTLGALTLKPSDLCKIRFLISIISQKAIISFPV